MQVASAGQGRHLAKTSAASAMKPRPARHVRLEIALLRQDEVDAGQAHQHAADDDGAVAQRPDRYARGVDRGGVFADRAQAQAEPGAVERPVGQRDHQEGDVGDEIVAGEQVSIDRADDRHGADLFRERPVDRAELRGLGQLRRAAALLPDRIADQRREAVGDHVDRRAGHDLIGALIDRGVAVDEREDDGRGDAEREPCPDVAGEGRAHRGAEGADQNLAFEADVDHAGTLRPEAREAGEDQRNARA